jgi:hypothetical protein
LIPFLNALIPVEKSSGGKKSSSPCTHHLCVPKATLGEKDAETCENQAKHGKVLDEK